MGSPPKLSQYSRQKARKKALQCQVIELAKVLQQLQTRKNEPKKIEEGEEPPTTSAWKLIARQCLKDRQTSEELHRFLSSAASGREALIDDLIYLVRRYTGVLKTITEQSCGLYSNVFLAPNAELIYAMDVHELNGVYRQTDAIFKDFEMASTNESAAFQRALTTEGGTPIVENGWQKHLPFSYRRTCDSMWMLSNLVHQQEAPEEFEDVEDPDNVVAAKVRFTRELEGCGFESQFVKRRFVEEDREVFVWKSSIRGDGAFRGLQVQCTGWSVIRRSATRSGTFQQTCTRQTPLHLCSGNKVPGVLVSQFDEFVQSMFRENYQEITKMAESLLLDDALDDIRL